MTHPIEWKVVLLKKGVNSDWGMDEISVERVDQNDETIFIYIFPRPTETPHCFYALLIFDKDKKWNYYTLELDFGSSTIFKEGGGTICDFYEFIKKVKEIRQNKPVNIAESFGNVDLKKMEEMGCKNF